MAVLAESTYNAIYSQTLSGSDGGSCYFNGGMPSNPNGNPPSALIWSFWPPSGTSVANSANLDLTLTGTIGAHYRVDSRPDLGSSWQVFADLASLAASPFTLSAPMSNAQQFFRAVGLP